MRFFNTHMQYSNASGHLQLLREAVAHTTEAELEITVRAQQVNKTKMVLCHLAQGLSEDEMKNSKM